MKICPISFSSSISRGKAGAQHSVCVPLVEPLQAWGESARAINNSDYRIGEMRRLWLTCRSRCRLVFLETYSMTVSCAESRFRPCITNLEPLCQKACEGCKLYSEEMKEEFNPTGLKSNLQSTQPLHTALRLHRSHHRVYFIVKHPGGRHRAAVDQDSHGYAADVFCH